MIQQKFNYHTHTQRCGHALGSDEQYVRAAIMAGFTELGFSEHMAYPGIEKPKERMLNKDIEEYLSSIHKLRIQYEKDIQIKVGFEIEYFDDQLVYLKEMRKKCDYMIVGQHCQFVDGLGYDDFSDDIAVESYTKQIVAAMKSGLISMVAHPDYFMLGRRNFSKTCEQAAHTICSHAVRYDIPLEINLNGLRYGLLYYDDGESYPYPYRAFWEIAAQYPIKVLYGYDAHKPVTLLEKERITKVEEILKGLTFNHIQTFVLK